MTVGQDIGHVCLSEISPKRFANDVRVQFSISSSSCQRSTCPSTYVSLRLAKLFLKNRLFPHGTYHPVRGWRKIWFLLAFRGFKLSGGFVNHVHKIIAGKGIYQQVVRITDVGKTFIRTDIHSINDAATSVSTCALLIPRWR